MAATDRGPNRRAGLRPVVEAGAILLVAGSLANTVGLILFATRPTPSGRHIDGWNRVLDVARSSDLTSAAIGAVALVALCAWEPLSGRGRVVLLLVSVLAALLAFSGCVGVYFQLLAPERFFENGYQRLTSLVTFAGSIAAAGGLGLVVARVERR
ncbi:MAG: hypothetical protein KatS3mg009_1990 [Acidimicrobiia bacterium]|nr:MAG: hypothetical protein KatS3mg009_1990 [Acidimicrobiia bacterium]